MELLVCYPDRKQERIPLDGEGEWTIGRDPSCDVVVADPKLSRRHMLLQWRNGTLLVRDLGSSNGLRVDGKQTLFETVRIGATISAGDTEIRFLSEPTWNLAAFHARLLERLDLRDLSEEKFKSPAYRQEVRRIADLLAMQENPTASAENRSKFVESVLCEVFGLGPLEALLADDSVTEIMVNAPNEVFIERNGRLQPASVSFSGNDAVRRIIERIVTPLGRRIDESSPMVDARLADGSRVNAIIPPLALKGPTITIRKFRRTIFGPEELLAQGSIDRAGMDVLMRAVADRRNLIVSGGTGTGKTTLLNTIASFIDPSERIITIEDAAELRLPQPHVVRLEAKPPNLEGKGAITIRDLVRNALRMRPDRIVVGECRGAEAIDMLQAMNTGHDGSFTTLHANSPADALRRVEVLALFGGTDLPLAAVREQTASGIHIVVQLVRLTRGKRIVSEIAAVRGLLNGGYHLATLWQHPEVHACSTFS